MLRYFIRRLVIAAFVAVTVSIIGFGLLRASGDLAVVLAGERATAADIADVAHKYGLDRSLPVQYADWVSHLVRGDLGRSLFTDERVSDLIFDRIGVTIAVAIPALILALLLSLPLGMIAALRANSWIDRSALALAMFGQAVPIFWLGLILIFIFGVMLRWLPISGSDSWVHFILPSITLAVVVLPPFMRLTRTGMIEVMASDYIRTAWAKGLRPHSVLFKHALRNAILPVVSLSALSLGFLLGGSVVVETIFALNGIGLLAFQSILRVDFPVVQSILVFVSLCYIVLTLISDLINAKLDPRIRLT
jgi:ABC-type dipeptide/oligopeptide/nickel transport system permease component